MITTLNGSAGCNNSSVPCNSFAGSPSGINNAGILNEPGVPLPVELLSFNAALNSDGRVSLTWATASELNNDFFEIEKSLDGTQWENISMVDGAGNSTNLTEYNDIDRHPSYGLSYYRLSQTDFDGTRTSSYIKVIVNKLTQVHSYPNPATNLIRFTGTDYSSNSFQLFDVFGKEVTSTVRVVDFDGSTLNLDVTLLSAGAYIFSSAGKNHRFIKK
jgi:hypothetical protein